MNRRYEQDRKRRTRKRPPRSPWLARRWHKRELALVGLLVCMPFVLAFLDQSIMLVAEAMLIAGAGIAAVILLRGDWTLFGPQFYYDIVCLARRGRSTNVRVLYVCALLIGQAFIYISVFGSRQSLYDTFFVAGRDLSINETAEFAQRFFGVVIVMQNLAVLLLTPIYVATAITEERERRTLELMFTSHLSDREIVFGKLAGRLVHMGGVLLAGLPVLSVSLVLGGVDMMVLLVHFALTAMNLLTVGSVCIMVSAQARKALIAVLISYGILLPFAFGFGCASWSLFSIQEFAAGYEVQFEKLLVLLFVHALIVGTCLTVAVSRLRSPHEAEFTIRMADDYDRPPRDRHNRQPNRVPELTAEERIVLRRPLAPLPPIEGDPLVWKEANLGGKIIAFSPAFWVPLGSVLIPVVLVLFAVAVLLGRQFDESSAGQIAYVFLKFLLMMLAGQFCLGVAFRASVTVALERQQKTLDALLTMPLKSRDIVSAKWWACLRKGWGWAIFFVPILLLDLVTRGIHPMLAAGMLAAPLVHGAFLASLGMVLSIVSPTVLAAQVRMALCALAFLAFYITELLLDVRSGWLARGNDVFNPIRCWHFLGSSTWEISRMPTEELQLRGGAALLHLGLFAALAYFLYRLACRFFDSEKYRNR